MGKSWIKSTLVGSGALRLAARLKGRGVVILMYHSVMDDPRRHADTLGGIIHSTQVFRGQMEWVARHCQAVSLDEVLLFVKGEKQLPPRAVAITFDDGYADNYEVAAPVLNQLGIPAAFYVTVDCVQNANLPWPSRLRYAFRTSRKRQWTEANGPVWPLGSAEQRDQAFLKASDSCGRLAGVAQEQFVRRLESELEAGPPELKERVMMTWDQVRGLRQQGHIVGSHTMTHPNMAYVGDEELNTEFGESKRRLEQALGAPVIHFSYPCPALVPHWAERTVEMSRALGYQTAVTTNGGLVRPRDNPLCLRRVRPTKTVDGLQWNLDCTFLGRAM